MVEQRFERDLREWLAADLDPVHGPHPRWADAPAARRVASSRTAPPRWRTVALLAAAVVGVVALALAVAVMPREIPVASVPPTLEPWPSAVGPSATPTLGEIALGRVAVATAKGEPALLVRVSRAVVRHRGIGGGIGVNIEVRVIGKLDRDSGIDRFIVVRGGRQEAPGLGVTGPDPLEISADAPVGTTVSAVMLIPAAAEETVDLGFAGSGTSIVFRYPVHRPPPPPSMQGRCPTLEDYAIASLQPFAEPAPPSFEPVAPDATPSTGFLQAGEVGVIPAPDGSPGALVRVSNIRFCERLPDYRPDWTGSDAKMLLADVEIDGLKAGALPAAFIAGKDVVVANYGGQRTLNGAINFNMPGANMTATLDTGPAFAYRGTVAWEVPDTDVRVTLDAQRAEQDAHGMHLAQFSYLAREGTDYTFTPGTPKPTSDPAATPTTGEVRPGDTVVLAADGGTTPLVVDGIAEVPRYPGVAPAPPATGFLEVRLIFGAGSGTFPFDPADWVVAGPAGGSLRELEPPRQGGGCMSPPGWPNIASCADVGEIPPDWPGFPFFVIAEVPAQGRISLEYRPDGGPALVTWVLRER